VPNGCFEQTTSTAWPNVLVNCVSQANQAASSQRFQLKAESLMSAGYQRLLTFEHAGGGYSWFGEQDPAPLLSVTAFGLMEFADMAQVQTVDEAMIRSDTRLAAPPAERRRFVAGRTSPSSSPSRPAWYATRRSWCGALATAGYTGFPTVKWPSRTSSRT